jgi:Cu+-exporting ATPase
MTLEPVIPELEEEENPELKDFSRRFWWTLPLTVIVTVLAMAGHSLQLFHGTTQNWVELALATPVTLWGGWVFFARGIDSIRHRSPNMWTLIGLGTAAASTAWPLPWFRSRFRRPLSRTDVSASILKQPR